jgi:hypothetical protein
MAQAADAHDVLLAARLCARCACADLGARIATRFCHTNHAAPRLLDGCERGQATTERRTRGVGLGVCVPASPGVSVENGCPPDGASSSTATEWCA